MRIFLICFLFFITTPLFAQDTALSDAEAGLSAIYASTTDMAEISVSIENGVATLTGDVANADIAAKAVEIAQGREGIVYVQDQLNRALVGENNVSDALSGLRQDLEEIQSALPIICLALLAFLFIGRHVLAPKIVERGFTRMVTANVGIDRTADIADGLHVHVVAGQFCSA